LRAAEQNIERLDDVIAQLVTQIDSLKRQARQAARYRAVSAEIRKSEAILWHLRREAAISALDAQGRVVGEAADEVGRLTGLTAAAAANRADAAAGLPELRNAEAEAAAALRHLMVLREGIDREKEQALARARELAERHDQICSDLSRERDGSAATAETLARLDAEETEIRKEAEQAESARGELERRVETATSELQDAEAALAEATSASAEMTARRLGHERVLREEEQRIGRMTAQLQEITTETEKLAAGDARALIDTLSGDAQAACTAADSAEAAAIEAEVASGEARQALEATREPLAVAERDLKALETEQATLAKVLAVDDGALWPPLIDRVSVEPGLEAALGAAFGDDLDHPADEGALIHWRGVAPSEDDPALPDGVIPLADVVGAPDVLRRRLAQTGLVTAEDGPRLQSVLRPGQRLVTAQGDLWRWDGYTAAADAPTTAARRLAQRNRLAELTREIGEAHARIDTLRQAADNAEAHASAEAARASEARAAARQAQRELAGANERLAAAERKAGQETSRLDALAETRRRLEASLAESQSTRNEAAGQLEAMAGEPDMTARIEMLKAAVSAARGQFSSAQAALDGHGREAELRSQRIERIAVERQRWLERSQDAERQIETLDARAAEIRAEAEALAGIPAELDARRATLATQIDEAGAARRQAADALAVGEAQLSDADRAAREAETALAAAREANAREEATLEGLRRRLADLEETILETLGGSGSEALRAAGIEAGATLPTVDRLEADIDRLKRERERLGSVNLRAEEEMREISDRYDSLVPNGRISRPRSSACARPSRVSTARAERLLAAFDDRSTAISRRCSLACSAAARRNSS
jgi:chromosome segregation protein